MRKLLPILLALILPLAACGGDSTGPDTRYPEIAGIYDLNAPIDGSPGARVSGTITLVDTDRNTPEFTGTYGAQVLAANGTVAGTFNGDITGGTITRSGQVNFNFDNENFRFTGTQNGRAITGTWLLRGTTSNFSGTFTASRR